MHRAHLALRMHTFRVEVCVHHNYLNYHSFILLPLSVLLILLTDASWLFFFSLFLPESEEQVEGYYRLRAVDYWERPGPYSEVTKYTGNL